MEASSIKKSFVSWSAIVLVTLIALIHQNNPGLVDTLVLVEEKGESCHLRELELCLVGSAALFQNPNGVPITAAEMKRQCEYLEESSECIHDYGDRCLTDAQHENINLFISDSFQVETEFCTNGTQVRDNYMKYAPCLRQVQKKHQRECISDLQVGFESIHKLNNGKQMITACCNLNRFKECILPRVQENCGQTALEMAKAYIARSIGTVFHKVCRDYDPTAPNCMALLPKKGTKPSNARTTSAISRAVSSYATTS